MNKGEKIKKGISLIVLVITIIVIVILAAAVILSIDNNNPIENAKKAKSLHNESVYQEELELYAINEYSDKNSTFNKDTLNVFDGEKLKVYISSMLDEDKDKYIIWQGKLVKKDGDVYKYTNGEEIKVFGNIDISGNISAQINLTEKMVEFAKLIEEIDLMYNGGYVTNIGISKTTLELKERINSDIIIKKNGEVLADTARIGTDYEIYDSNNNLLAKTVVYGETNVTGYINASSRNPIYSILDRTFTEMAISRLVASDTDHNGIIDNNDHTPINQYVANNIPISQNAYAIIPKF